MKTLLHSKLYLLALFTSALIITSCSPGIMLSSSWKNRDAKVKSSPTIMVLALGKPNSAARRDFENNMVERLKKEGFKAVPASDYFEPGVTKMDSAGLVSILRKNNIDMLLANAVRSITENDRFIPGAVQGSTTDIPVGAYAGSTYYSGAYIGYVGYNYYNYYSAYQTIDAPPVSGTTVTDVTVIIESNLYEVATPLLIWHGESKAYTKEPSKSLINEFSKNVISDIKKNNLLIK